MKSLHHFLKNVHTALKDPEILEKWARWQFAQKLGRPPRLRIHDAVFEGFPNFNAYLGAWKSRPTDAEFAFIRDALVGAQIVLDVGANFGTFSVLFSYFAPEARIFAFEPHPSTVEILRNNIVLNECSGMHVVPSAVGAGNGAIGFSSGTDSATNCIQTDEQAALRVPVVTLDKFLGDQEIDFVDFLKIDVEGAELDVLKGALQALREKRIRKGVIEICPENLNKFGKTVDDIGLFFNEHGYDLCWIDREGGIGAAVDPSKLSQDCSFDAVFKSRL